MGPMVSFSRVLCILATGVCLACGGSKRAPAAAPTYRFAEAPKAWEGPIWVEFLPGDEISVWLTVDGDAVEPLTHTTKVRVRRKFYLLYDRDGITLSFDKQNLTQPAANVSVLLGESAEGSGLGFRLTVPPSDPL